MRRTASRAAMLAIAIVSLMAVSVPMVVAATSWRTKASVTSDGASYWDTATSVHTVIERAYAIRFGLRTPDGSKRVKVNWYATCDNGHKANERIYTTPANGGTEWVTIFAGSDSLGAFCDVAVSPSLNDTARLITVIQAKHR